MKMTINKNDFEKNIQNVLGAAGDGKNMLPILSHLLLTVKGDTATISASDLSIELCSTFAIMAGEDGSIAIPAKKLSEIAKELPAGEVHLTTGTNNVFTISAGKSRFNISGLDAQEFPTLKKPETELTVPFGADALSLFLNQTKHAICSDETKFNLCGVFMHVKDGKLIFAATNGHRLSVVEREKELPEGFLPKIGVIIPKKGVLEICKIADQCKGGKISLAYNGNTVFVQTDSTRLSVRLIDGDYPEYSKVIPAGDGSVATINKQTLAQALKRVTIMSDEESKDGKSRARLAFSSGLLNVSASNNTTGEASEEFEIQYDGEPKELNINSRYALEALSAIGKEDEEVKLSLFSDGKPITLTGMKPGFLSIIMPMRA